MGPSDWLDGQPGRVWDAMIIREVAPDEPCDKTVAMLPFRWTVCKVQTFGLSPDLPGVTKRNIADPRGRKPTHREFLLPWPHGPL
jgi:hypothetical protein